MSDTKTWKKIGPFAGRIYAEMVSEVLKERDIPHYISDDWFTGALGIKGASAVGNTAFIFVPDEYIEDASNIVAVMFNKENS